MKRLLLAIALIVASTAEAGAAAVTLEECVELALRNNRGLKSAEMEVAAAKEDVVMSRAGFFPALKLNAAYSLIDRPMRLIIDRNSFGSGIPGENVEITTQERDFYFLSLSLEQPLFTGWRLTHTLRKSEAAADETLLHAERERETLAFQVKKAYYDVLNARLQSEVAEKILEAKRERLRVIDELHREGYVRRDDLLRQESDLALAELDLDRSRHRKELALNSLRRLLYLDDDADFSITGVPRRLSLAAPLKDVTRFAIENRKELKMAQARLRGADEDIAIARSAYYPKASLQGSYLRQKETNITRTDQWVFTASLDWSIFEWGKTAADVRQKVAGRQRLQYLREEQEQSVAQDAERAWREIKEKELGVRVGEKRVRTYEEVVRITAERYTEGTAKLVDVIEMETQFVQEFNRYMTSVNELNAAIAALEHATSGAPADWFAEQRLYAPEVNFDMPGGKALPGREITPTPPPPSPAQQTAPTSDNALPEPPPSDAETIIESLLQETFASAGVINP